jgi:hypothetical protein
MGRLYGKSVMLVMSVMPARQLPVPEDAPHQGGAVSATLRYSREKPPVKGDQISPSPDISKRNRRSKATLHARKAARINP